MNDLVEFYSIAILNGGMDENFRITKPLVLGTFGGGREREAWMKTTEEIGFSMVESIFTAV